MKAATWVKTDNPAATFEIRQAVVALELGPADTAVLDYLDFLAAQLRIKALDFIHVLPKLDLFNALYEREQEALVSNYELNEEVVRRMESKIRKQLGHVAGSRIDFNVREGDPLEETLNRAGELEADLIVIGQRAGTDHHAILARNLVRKASANVLVVPEASRLELNRILVPIDFSSNSAQALRTALGLGDALALRPETICANVYEMPNLSVYKIQKTREELQRMVEEDRQVSFRAFLHTHAPHAEERVETVLIERDQSGIAHYLVNFARARDIDLIVLGAKGHSKVELLLLGSVAERLLSINDRIPVLVVKET